jgi:short-subunit dehydrogenase
LLWLTPEQVARAGVAALSRNDRILIPGMHIRTGATLQRLLPRALTLRLLDRYYRV